MTNYNERLDEIIRFVNMKGYVGGDNKLRSDITSLIKELVEKANLPNEYQDRLLKMLENENGIDSAS